MTSQRMEETGALLPLRGSCRGCLAGVSNEKRKKNVRTMRRLAAASVHTRYAGRAVPIGSVITNVNPVDCLLLYTEYVFYSRNPSVRCSPLVTEWKLNPEKELFAQELMLVSSDAGI